MNKCTAQNAKCRTTLPRIARRRQGFTFIELMVGIVVTSIVLGAMGVFTYGVGQGWTSSESAQSVFLAGDLATDRIERVIRAAKLIDSATTIGSLDNSTPAAACMFWRNDDNADGKIQFSEMALLSYDAASKTVFEYTVQWPAGWSAAQISSADWTASPAGLMTPANFIASSHVVSTPLAHNVEACQLFPIAAGSTALRPSLEFVLKIGNGQAMTVQYGAATLRCPNSEPN